MNKIKSKTNNKILKTKKRTTFTKKIKVVLNNTIILFILPAKNRNVLFHLLLHILLKLA